MSQCYKTFSSLLAVAVIARFDSAKHFLAKHNLFNKARRQPLLGAPLRQAPVLFINVRLGLKEVVSC